MAKHLCKLGKSVKKNFDVIVNLVDKPRFICMDCGRAANDKQRLCSPKGIPGAKHVAKEEKDTR